MRTAWECPKIDEYIRAMDGLPTAVLHSAAKIIIEASQPMVEAMRAGIHSDTGLLAQGLRARNAGGAGRPAVVIKSVTTRGRWNKSGRRSAAGAKSDKYRVYYGMMVETGHRSTPRNKIAGGRFVGMANTYGKTSIAPDVPPHPFMRPAFDAMEESVGQVIEDALGAAIDAAWAAGT